MSLKLAAFGSDLLCNVWAGFEMGAVMLWLSKLPNENRPNCRMAIALHVMICYNICRYEQL